MILEARGISRSYGRVRALHHLDLQVAEGEVVGLLGPNGAGKSTAFRLLAGLEIPDQGSVLLAGQDVSRWPLHRRARQSLGYLPQHASLFPRLGAAENVAVALRSVRRDPGEAQALLDEAGLGALARRRAGALSGGERRRVELVRCLALRPRVVLLDEPFAGIDPVHVQQLQDQVARLTGQGVGVLLTDHQVGQALGLCDRVVLLDGGVVLVSGTPQEVASHPEARRRYLGEGFTPRAQTPPLHEPESAVSLEGEFATIENFAEELPISSRTHIQPAGAEDVDGTGP